MRVRSLVLLALGVVVVGGVALMLTGLDGFSARSEPSAVERLMARSMRRYAVPNSYERLKTLTRGVTGMTRESLHAFIDGLPIPADARTRLKALTPATYIGKAAELAKRV